MEFYPMKGKTGFSIILVYSCKAAAGESSNPLQFILNGICLINQYLSLYSKLSPISIIQ